MRKHTIIYLRFFGYYTCDFIECEMCGGQAVDIHHIDARGMGGSKLKDFIENLMGLCRRCHDRYGDLPQFMENLTNRHKWFMINRKTDAQRR